MKVIRIGTDCSGIEAPIQALIQMKIPFKHKWACDYDKYSKQSIEANYKPEQFYDDITKRDHSKLPDIDMYVCGFPCQPFSSLGSKRGTDDPRGNIMLHCIEVIKQKMPKVFILENVKNFKFIDNGKVYEYLLNKLENIGEYNIYPEILNTKDYGIPQNRQRIFIIGIRKDIQKKEWITPKEIPMIPLKRFILDKMIYPFDKTKLSKTLMIKVQAIKNQPGFVIQYDKFTKSLYERAPTIVTNSYLYHTTYNRFLTLKEMLLLQGFPKDFIQVVSDTQIKKQIGNSMSVNVLIALFNEIFENVS